MCFKVAPHTLYLAQALTPYKAYVEGDFSRVEKFFDRLDGLSADQYMEDMFDNDSWQAFIESGFYPYNLGLIFKFSLD